MKIFAIENFISYTYQTIVEKLEGMGHQVVKYRCSTPVDNYVETQEEALLKKAIEKEKPQGVFTVNIWPPVARVCHSLGIPYLGWSYDSPLNLATNQDLDYDTNFFFLFDRVEAASYRGQGLNNFYHLPLATDTRAWDKIQPGPETYQVSMVGNLYESTLPLLRQALSPYNRGYLQAMVEMQQKIYGCFLIDEVMTPEVLEDFNQDFEKTSLGHLSWKQVAMSIATYVTYMDRMSILSILSKRAETHLFTEKMSEENKKILPNLKVHGRVSYLTEMPKVFKQSKINLNPSLRIIRSGISQRCLDVMACQGFLLSSYQPELADYFVPDQELVLYESIEDAVEKALFYLAHEDLRQEIALAGRKKVEGEFSYEKQLNKMLEIAGL
ncbi:MAG: glycosyltransferase [Eubacterium sp.]|nr:glycosyltransferase [Eubacterium sp.]